MVAWLLTAVIVANAAAIAAAYALQVRDTREQPRLDAETREILRGWTEE